MINPDHRRYFIAESGDILAKVTAYREEYNRVHKILWDYVQSIGGKSYALHLDGGLHSVQFKNAVPSGFKPMDKQGLCRPRMHSRWEKEFAELPRMPRAMDYLAGCKPLLEVEFRTEPGAPVSKVPVGNPNNMLAIDWYDKIGPIMVMLPDQVITCAALKRAHPQVEFLNDEHKHDPDTTGLREILLKEWELLEEKHQRGMLAA